MPDLRLQLGSAKQAYGYGESIKLIVEVVSKAATPLFVVVDRLYVHVPTHTRLELLLAEQAPTSGLGYYGYQPPRLRRIAPGATASQTLTLGTPPKQTVIHRDGALDFVDQRLDGVVTVTLTLGYLITPFRARTNGALAEFVDAQKHSPRATTKITIDGP